MKKTVLVSLLALSAFASSAAFAQSASAAGLYVTGNVGVADQNGLAASESAKASVGVAIGAKVSKDWSVEASYQDMGKRDFGAGDATFSATTLAAVGALPYSGDVSFLGKVGVARTAVDQKIGGGSYAAITKTNVMLGAGVDFQVDKNLTVRGMVDVYPDFAGSDETMTQFSIGMKYAF